MKEEGRANVRVKLLKALFFRKVCVPQPDGLGQIELSGQIAADPPIGKSNKINFLIFQVPHHLWVYLGYNNFHFFQMFVHARLQLRIVVLDAIQQGAQTPICVSFGVYYIFHEVLVYLFDFSNFDLWIFLFELIELGFVIEKFWIWPTLFLIFKKLL